jgi:hypothetical protein
MRQVLHDLWEKRVLSPDDLEAMAHSYEDWQAVWALVRAGWAADGTPGFVMTDEGDHIAAQIFKPNDGE